MSMPAGPRSPCLIHLSLLASHYRQLASRAENPGVAQELSRIAQSYEKELDAGTDADVEDR